MRSRAIAEISKAMVKLDKAQDELSPANGIERLVGNVLHSNNRVLESLLKVLNENSDLS